MAQNIYAFDPTAEDQQSKVRGIGRYLILLKENFPNWTFVNKFSASSFQLPTSIFINPFFNFLQPPLTMKRLAKKQIAVIHDLIPLKYADHFPVGIKGSINIYLNRLALKNYDLVVTDSLASKKDIVQMLKIDENRVRIIYPCLPKSFLKIKNLKLEIKNSCLYVGDATWNKNLVNLARAIKIADVNCVFVGKVFEPLSGKEKIPSPKARVRRSKKTVLSFSTLLNNPWQKEFKEFIVLTKDDKRFIFKGFVTDYELVKLYQQAQVNILVSRDEGFGFSYLEAGRFGCPSILADISVLKEISAEQGAVFANPNNPQGIAQKIKNLANDQDLRNVLSLEAQERSKYFSNKKFISGWEKIILATS